MDSNNNHLALPENLNLQTVEDVHQQFVQAAANGTLILDASGVEKVDTAGVQLLLSLKTTLEQTNHSLQWQDISEPLEKVIQATGLSKALK